MMTRVDAARIAMAAWQTEARRAMEEHQDPAMAAELADAAMADPWSVGLVLSRKAAACPEGWSGMPVSPKMDRWPPCVVAVADVLLAMMPDNGIRRGWVEL